MHEFLVADALKPGAVCILNLPLAEYSLGHELILLRQRNALLTIGGEEFSKLEFWQQLHALREAVWICSDPFSARARFERLARVMWRFRWNEWKRKRWVRGLRNWLPDDYAVAVAEFRNYLAAARPNIPTAGNHAVAALYGDEEVGKGRCFGQPLLLSLYNFVITLPDTERGECAWDFPFARAMWLFFGKLEAEGTYRIENAREFEEQQVYEEASADARKRSAEESRVQSPESTGANSAGLATALPDLDGAKVKNSSSREEIHE